MYLDKMVKKIGQIGKYRPKYPSTLENAFQDIPTLYFDQFVWIKLTSGELPGFRLLLEIVQVGLRNNRLKVVISENTYKEMQGPQVKNKGQQIGLLVAEISQFQSLPSRSDLVVHELNEVLNEPFGFFEIPSYPLFDKSVRHTFGPEVPSVLSDEHYSHLASETLVSLRQQIEDEVLLKMLTGPDPVELDKLKKTGFIGDIALTQAEQYARSQESTSAQMSEGSGSFRKFKLQEFVLRDEFSHTLAQPFQMLWGARGKSNQDFEKLGGEVLTALLLSMPSTIVATALASDRHQNPQKPWTRNDVFDHRHVAAAFPYVSMVYADKDVASSLINLGLDDLFAKRVPKNVDEAINIVQSFL